MRLAVLSVLIGLSVVVRCPAGEASAGAAGESRSAALAAGDFVAIPGHAESVQFRLYTNAAPGAAHLFGTFELDAYGNTLLRSPAGDGLQRWLKARPFDDSLHNVLVNGRGPNLAPANGMTVLEQATGPEWRYLALDETPAYRDRLDRFTRRILFVEPDLFVLYDHLKAREPIRFQMLLHPPVATRVDTNWADLRLNLPAGGFRIGTPGRKGELRSWSRVASVADEFLPGTVTMQLGPTNRQAELDVLTVFAVYPPGKRREYMFKLLESNSAIGARIHRDGLPTLIAFKTDRSAQAASLTGFGFTGPVGVSVFRPMPRSL